MKWVSFTQRLSLQIKHVFTILRRWNEFYVLKSVKASTFCLLKISAKRKNANHKKLVERLNNNALKQCFLSEAHSSSLSSKGLTKTFQRENLNSRENLNYLIVCFTQCSLFFQHVFLLPVRLPCLICGKRIWRNVATSDNSRCEVDVLERK